MGWVQLGTGRGVEQERREKEVGQSSATSRDLNYMIRLSTLEVQHSIVRQERLEHANVNTIHRTTVFFKY